MAYGEVPTGIVAITLAGAWVVGGVEDDDELPQPHSDHSSNTAGNAPIIPKHFLIWQTHGHLVWDIISSFPASLHTL